MKYDSGKILFVGGPKHGKILSVQWHKVVEVPIYPKVPVSAYEPFEVAKSFEMSFKAEYYRLQMYVTAKGCQFLLYQHQDMTNDEVLTFLEPKPVKGFSLHKSEFE